MLKKFLRELKKTTEKEKLELIYKKIHNLTDNIVQNNNNKSLQPEIKYLKNKYIYIIDIMNTKLSKIKLNIIYSNWSSIFYSKKYFNEGTDILKICYQNLNNEIIDEKKLVEKNLEFILVFGIVCSNLVMFYLKREAFKDAFFYGRNFNKKIRVYIKKNKKIFFEDEYLVYLFVQSFFVIAFCLAKFDCLKYKELIFRFFDKSKIILESKFKKNSNYYNDLMVSFKNFKIKVDLIFQKNKNNLNNVYLRKTSKAILSSYLDKIIENKNKTIKKINFDNFKKTFILGKRKKVNFVKNDQHKNYSFIQRKVSENLINLKIKKNTKREEETTKSEKIFKILLKELQSAKIERSLIIKQQQILLKNFTERQSKFKNKEFKIEKLKEKKQILSNLQIEKKIYLETKISNEKIFWTFFINSIKNYNLKTFINLKIKNGRESELGFYFAKNNKNNYFIQILQKTQDEFFETISYIPLKKIYTFLNLLDLEIFSNPLKSCSEIKNLFLFLKNIFIFFIKVIPNIIKNDDLILQTDFKNDPNFPLNFEEGKKKNKFKKKIETLIENNYYRINSLDFNNKLILQVFLVNKFDNFLISDNEEDIYEFVNQKNKGFEIRFLYEYDLINIYDIKNYFFDYYKMNIDRIKKKIKFSHNKDKHFVFFLKLKIQTFMFILFYFNKKKNKFFIFYETIKRKNILNNSVSVFDKMKIDEFFHFFRISKNEINEEDYPFILNFIVEIIVKKKKNALKNDHLKKYLDTNILSKFFDFQLIKI